MKGLGKSRSAQFGKKSIRSKPKSSRQRQGSTRLSKRFLPNLTRGIEVLAVLSSFLWATQALEAPKEGIPSESQAVHHTSRTPSAVKIPLRKLKPNELGYLGSTSRSKDPFQIKIDQAATASQTVNAGIGFKQDPYVIQSQFEILRFPTSFKK